MADLTKQKPSLSAIVPALVAASAGGDAFENTGNEILMVKNGGAAPITVTINSQQKCSQGFDHDVQVTVAAGEEKWIGTFNKKRFNDAQGKVQVTYSDATSVTVGVAMIAAS